MKATIPATTLLLATLLLSGASLAAGDHDHMSHGAMKMSQTDEAPMADGTVKKVDKANGKLTLAHGALTNLNMPAMTMAFRVKESTWLDRLKEGDKIRFVADNVQGALTVVRFEIAK